MSSRACLSFGCVEPSIYQVGEAPFQTPHGFVVAFAFGSFPQVVGPARGVLADLGDGHDVQAAVELAIAGARKSVADHLAGGPSIGAVPV